MRVLVLLFALLSMPVLAAAASWPDAAPAGGEVLLAQQTQQKPSGPTGPSGSSGSSRSSGPSGSIESRTSPRHPGDYCTSHCRPNEIPCGRGCMSNTSGSAKCQEKTTTTCAGKP
jgi:hypothetical protein